MDLATGAAGRGPDALRANPATKIHEPAFLRYYEFNHGGVRHGADLLELIGPAKIAQLDLPLIGIVSFGPACCFFRFRTVFDDILTEVYGYAVPSVIWAGFAGLAFAALWPGSWSACPRRFLENQAAYEIAFGSTWRIGSGLPDRDFRAGSSSTRSCWRDENSHAGRWL